MERSTEAASPRDSSKTSSTAVPVVTPEESPPDATVAAAADAAILLVYGAVVAFFVWRFVRWRRVASLGVAFLPTGWILVACWHLGVVDPHDHAVLRWLGVIGGLLLLVSVIRAEAVTPAADDELTRPRGVK